MLDSLVKLANYLDEKQKRKQANKVDFIIHKLSQQDNLEAPKPWQLNQGDITGEWDITEEMEQDDLPTEEMSFDEVSSQHKPSVEITKAIQTTTGKFNQIPVSIDWHIPGDGKSIESVVSEQPLETPESDQSYWVVSTRSSDPTDTPDAIGKWAFWEVDSQDPFWMYGEPIEGSNKRLYGEW